VHHVTLERWSGGDSPLHRRDPRAKTVVLLVFLVVVATTHRLLTPLAALWLVLLAAATISARLPLAALLLRASLVLPFSLLFALVNWLAGDPQRALALVLKSYLSAAAVLLLVATTPIPRLLHGLEMAGVPRFLLMVTQFLYRYLFVISEEAQHMRTAATARGASARGLLAHGARFRAAGGALAVLFARSYGRAEEIHRAMLARGFEGHFPPLTNLRVSAMDVLFVLLAAPLPLALRLAAERAWR
jgi:cobalt/nickel transport system permease protein